MFSQYNVEKQAEARQADVRRESARAATRAVVSRPPARDDRRATLKSRLGLLLAAAAPVVLIVAWSLIAR